MKAKDKCCKKYKKKGSSCKSCPLLLELGKKKHQKLMEKYA